MNRTRGFTLVELLIALVLIAVITVLLFGGLRLGSRTWEGVERVSERVADLRTTLSLVAALLRQSRDAEVQLEDGPVRVFSGTDEALEWVAPLSEQVGTPGLYVLRLAVERGEHERLVLTRWLLHPDVLAGGGEFPAWTPLAAGESVGDGGPLDEDAADGVYGRTVLLPIVQKFEVGYFGTPVDTGLGAAPTPVAQPDAAGAMAPDTGEWVDEWLEQPTPPRRVRITVATPGQTWPALEVAIPAGDIGVPR